MKQSIKAVPRHAIWDFPLRRPSMPDGVTVLTVYLVLLLGIPSNLGVGPLGGAGSPASLFGMGMLVWWVWDHLHRPRTARAAQWVRTSMAVFCGCVLLSYVGAALSPLPQLDVNGADRGLLRMASFAGVLLVANDGIPGATRFVAMLRRLVSIVTVYACVGLAQFFTRRTIVDAIQIPGLTAGDDPTLGTRVDFARAQATATHALEYSSVLAIAVPLAVTFAMYDRTGSGIKKWASVAILCLAAVLSVSRSSLVGLAIGILVLMPTWRPAIRRVAIVVSVAGFAAIYVLIPGMMGTLAGMFSGASGDSSVESRTSGFAIVGQLFTIHPLVGRGLGTFLPSYRILDDQYLDLLVEVGILGLSAYLAVLLMGIITVRWRRQPAQDGLTSALGNALCASVVAGGVLTAFFDSFSFQQASALLIMTAGLCGGYRNLERLESADGAPDSKPEGNLPASTALMHALRKRWYVAAAVVVCTVPAVLIAQRAQGVYYSAFSVSVMMPPGATAGNPLWTGSDGMVPYAALVQRMVTGDDAHTAIETVAAPLYGTGARNATRIYLPNSGGQWRSAFRSPDIMVEIVGPTRSEVAARSAQAVVDIERASQRPQREMGVPERALITTSVSPPTPWVAYVGIRTARAVVGIAALALAVCVGAAVVADRLADRLQRRVAGHGES